MQVQIWIGKDYLEQLYKNINTIIPDEDVFDSAVEYTDIALIEGQVQVSIKYDKYIELKDNGLLVQWSGANLEL